jgi:LuxR family maltose regulon positive regulatory protein
LLPESKFRPPAARTGIVARTALVERLAATQAPVITVTAPPGYGKTTLLAQWAERVGSRVAWLSCDDGDNDPVVLLSALAVALGRIGPVDPAIFPALASSGADISIVPRFVSAVASVQPPVTVLLDHADAVTSRQCLLAITEFALRLPPGWQLAVASRAELPCRRHVCAPRAGSWRSALTTWRWDRWKRPTCSRARVPRLTRPLFTISCSGPKDGQPGCISPRWP